MKERWRSVLARVGRRLVQEEVSVLAAGAAFFAFLALWPTLLAFLLVYGTLADPTEVAGRLQFLKRLLPPATAELVTEKFQAMARHAESIPSASAFVSLLAALASAAKGTKALLRALGAARPGRADSGRLHKAAVSWALTSGAIATAAVALSAVVAMPGVVGRLALSDGVVTLIRWSRWPVLACVTFAWLAALFRYGPGPPREPWRDVVAGAGAATSLWLLGSALFSAYLSRFGEVDEIYGSLAAVILLLTWFLLTAYAVFLGAELNAALRATRPGRNQAG